MALASIVFLPLISFAILILLGRRLKKTSATVSLLALAGSLVLSVLSFYELQATHQTLRFTWEWASLGKHPIQIGLLGDPLSITMCLVVTVVGWLIMLYSVGYMGEDHRFSRFFAYLSLFSSSMLLLVLADNLLLLYIGWEVVGLCSYLLISFWFERPAAANAGKKAFLTTRVGDLGLLAAILLIAQSTGNLSLLDLESKAAALGPWLPWVALLIFLGATGKSAQIPLHVWLPDAMEGPTPVSALIHAATMVAAGVYLVARTLPLFLPSPDALLAVALVGGATSFFAATVACTQTDLKRILAYSTISQLGLMMMALGCGSATGSMFHLVTHAWFKALLFLAAGSVIHALHHQEITRMGGLLRPMPVTALTFLAGALSMAGIPPLSGFWSKEEILLAAQGKGTAFLALGLSISFLTAFYISRAWILTFLGISREESQSAEAPGERPEGVLSASEGASSGRSHKAQASGSASSGRSHKAQASGSASSGRSHPHESPWVMIGPLLLLSLGAIGIGFIGTPFTGHWFHHFLGNEVHLHGTTGFTENRLLIASIAVAIGGISLSILHYGLGVKPLPAFLRRLTHPIYTLIHHKYFIDEIYDRLIVQPILRLSTRSFRFDLHVIDEAVNKTGIGALSLSRFKGWVDQVIVDGLVNGLGNTVAKVGGAVRLIQTGLVQNYLLMAASGSVLLFLLLRWIP